MKLSVKEGYSICTVKGDTQSLDWLRNKLRVTRDDETADFFSQPFIREGAFPSGLLAFLKRQAHAEGVQLDLQPLPTIEPKEVSADVLEGLTLRDYQVVAVRKGLLLRRGIFNLATGAGKTESFIAIAKLLEPYAASKSQRTSLTILPSKISAEQTYERFKKRGLKSVGLVSAPAKEFKKKHVVANYKTLIAALNKKHPDALALMKNVCAVFFDECHHLASPSWQKIAKLCQAEFRYGFSGTPFSSGVPYIAPEDAQLSSLADWKVISQTGEVVMHTPSKLLRDMGILVEPKIWVVEVRKPRCYMPFPSWKKIYKKGIITNEYRNELIVNIGYKLFRRGHRVAILVTSIDHGLTLLKNLTALGLKVAFSKGNGEVFFMDGGNPVSTVEERATEEAQKKFTSGELDVLVCSVVYDESVDLPVMSALLLAGGMKSPIRAIQRIGRTIRSSEGKEEAVVIDFRDAIHFYLNNHTNKRLAIYGVHEYAYEEVTPEEFMATLVPVAAEKGKK